MVSQIKKEIFIKVWNLVNELRGSVDAWEFKNYILSFLFYRYISEDFSRYINSKSGIPTDFRYENEKDDAEWIEHMKDMLIQEKGYFIYPNDLFINIYKRVCDGKIEDLNEEVRYVFNKIEESTHSSNSRRDFEGLFKLIDLSNDRLGKEIIQKNKKIKEIIVGIGKINFLIGNEDIFGDVYEYLIGMYVSNAGKLGGEFYTPPEVSELLVQLVSISEQDKDRKIRTVYDPACGFGSLLLKFVNKKEIQFFGQEINFTTYDFCRMNMFLHKIDYNNFDISLGDTLVDDKFKNIKFDVIVSHLPYKAKWESSDNPDLKDDPRFLGPGVLAPKNKTDFAFIMHSLYHLEENGVAAIICYPGILFRDKAEREIRKYLVENNYIDAIIQLSDNLFFGTNNPFCVLILKKNKSQHNKDILFINAEDYWVKKNKKISQLSAEHISQIIQFYKDRKDIDLYTKVSNIENIRNNEYDLSVKTYVTRKEQEEKIDIDAIDKDTIELSEKVSELNKKMDYLIWKIKASE